MTSPMPGTDSTADELVLEPPAPVAAVTPAQATSAVRIDPAVASQIQAAVTSYVDSLTSLEAQSPAFEQKVASISRMGHEEIRRSAEASNRFLNKPTAALKQGPMSQGSEVSHALLSLRQQIESLDPSRHLGQRRGLFRRSPFSAQVGEYFRKYQSSQTQIEAIVNGLYRGQDELLRDNAALEQEKVHLWEMKRRLDQYAYMAAQLDETLTRKIAELQPRDPEKAKALQEDALFYVRQKRQDLLTQLAVTVQGYLALDLIRKNNAELIKGVERATTTTVSALRTAVIAALALGNQRLVLDQITALNTTTGNIIESTSQMLRQQTAEIQNQAASSTVSIEKLQAAFNNIYATIDTIDAFKLAALDNMRATIDTLSKEVSRAQVYVERARSAELAQAQANGLVNELALPASQTGA
ncbi:MAG TPA: toxic anion resistance protein [Chloroflexota bacterium]|nr:toxic anion resistance protein [Chloroflexota bacterium]